MTGTLSHYAAAPQGFPAGVMPAMNARVRSGALLAGAAALALWGAAHAWDAGRTPDAMPRAAAPEAGIEKNSLVSRGVVEAIHELPPQAGSSTRRFEMTIRMRDGTLRTSKETGDARWRAGDKIRLIGPAAAGD